MKDIAKKTAKGIAKAGENVAKVAATAILAEITKEIIDETGVKDLAKAKMMEVGIKLFKEMDMNPKDMQRDLLKDMIKKELNLK